MACALAADYVRSVLDYYPETGEFRWRERPREHFATQRACSTWNASYSGAVAGTKSYGYVQISICGALYRAHRLTWLYMTGEWPEDQIDHVNGVRSDNRFCNLREATNSQNMLNRGAYSTNTSGVKGVSRDKQRNKWRATIQVNSKKRHIGLFDNVDDAAAAYAKAANELHGKFARAA